MNLPENYIVTCETQEEINKVINFIELENSRIWQFRKHVVISKDEWNIFDIEDNVKDWFKSKNVSDYKTFTFKKWKEMKETNQKPYKENSEVTYEMITNHPYFKTIDDEKLIEVLKYMDSEDYRKIPGNHAIIEQKLEGLKSIFKQTNKMKLTVSITEVLEIHKIACSTWKSKIAQYLTRVTIEQNIRFTQSEVDEMFKAATTDQKPVLTKIFGEPIKPIEWNRIKTGSKVMLKETDKICNITKDVDFNKEFDVVFYNTPYLIFASHKFSKESICEKYCTFHQNSKFVLFNASKIDYITEVIEY